MKLALVPINIGMQSLEQIVGLAQLAEGLGFESVWTFEHVMVPVEYDSKYPYSSDGKMGGGSDAPFLDPLIALTAVAAQTKTLRLGTGVNILSQANPLLLAKQAATLDLLSNGRFMLGAGIGWLKEEFEAMGVPFERRGAWSGPRFSSGLVQSDIRPVMQYSQWPQKGDRMVMTWSPGST